MTDSSDSTTRDTAAGGVPLTDAMIERMADEAERGYDPEQLSPVPHTIRECPGCRALQHKLERAGSDRIERHIKRDIIDHQVKHHGLRYEDFR